MLHRVREIEQVLGELIEAYRELLEQVTAQQDAMRAFDLEEMQRCAKRQESLRARIGALEARRRGIVAQLPQRPDEATVSALAARCPERREALLKLRDELKEVVTAVAERTHVSARLAGSVLGHLNTVVRLVAGAVEQAGVYTKQGVPRVAGRIGRMEAVG